MIQNGHGKLEYIKNNYTLEQILFFYRIIQKDEWENTKKFAYWIAGGNMEEWKDFETVEAIQIEEDINIEESETVFGVPIMKVHVQGELPPDLNNKKHHG